MLGDGVQKQRGLRPSLDQGAEVDVLAREFRDALTRAPCCTRLWHIRDPGRDAAAQAHVAGGVTEVGERRSASGVAVQRPAGTTRARGAPEDRSAPGPWLRAPDPEALLMVQVGLEEARQPLLREGGSLGGVGRPFGALLRSGGGEGRRLGRAAAQQPPEQRPEEGQAAEEVTPRELAHPSTVVTTPSPATGPEDLARTCPSTTPHRAQVPNRP